MSGDNRQIVEQFFRLMHDWENWKFLELFAPDASYIEPFSGQRQTHRGIEAIRKSFLDQWKQAPPGFRLELGQVNVSGAHVRAEWNCTWDGLGGEMTGADEFEIQDGKIRRLEVIVTRMPEIPAR